MASNCNYNHICVIDFEATCEDGMGKEFYPHEIIEFPAILINIDTCAIVSSFHSFVRPTLYPELSDFCQNLTGITQVSINNAETFEFILPKFERWINSALTPADSFVVLTDGCWDIKKFLCLQCIISHLDFPSWAEECIDVKHTFKLYNNETYKVKLMDMLNFYGLSFKGRLHSGKDDAFNIAQLVLTMLRKECLFTVNFHFSPSSTKYFKKKLSAYLKKKEKDKCRHKKQTCKTANDSYSLNHDTDSVMEIDPDLIGCENVLLKHKRR